MLTVMQWIRSNPRIPHTPREFSVTWNENKATCTGVSIELLHTFMLNDGRKFETSDVQWLKHNTPEAA